MTTHHITPLRLGETWWPRQRSVRGLVRGYELANGTEVTNQDPATFNGTEGVVSTARDVRRLLRGLFNGALLGPRELTAMLTPVQVDPHYSTLESGHGLVQQQTSCRTLWGYRVCQAPQTPAREELQASAEARKSRPGCRFTRGGHTIGRPTPAEE
jgi:CubicO group peptidase (beta-lactamase class C family)